MRELGKLLQIESAQAHKLFFDTERSSLRKGFLLNQNGALDFDNTLDMSSVYGVFMFEFPIPKPLIASSIVTIERELLNSAPIGGVPRYENDHYFASKPAYKGNPWFVTTLWLAQYYIRIGATQQASTLVRWCLDRSSSGNTLSEQVHPETGSYTGVSPLVWSHAELVNTILDFSDGPSNS